jgi:hypothetical protein
MHAVGILGGTGSEEARDQNDKSGSESSDERVIERMMIHLKARLMESEYNTVFRYVKILRGCIVASLWSLDRFSPERQHYFYTPPRILKRTEKLYCTLIDKGRVIDESREEVKYTEITEMPGASAAQIGGLALLLLQGPGKAGMKKLQKSTRKR